MFTHDNGFRRFCHFVSNHRWFGNSLLVCIIVSSCMLAAEDPVNYGSKTNEILNKFDYFFTSVFTIEICLKLISYGVVLHKGAFCRSLFNILDLFVVIISLVSIGLPFIMY
jgi:voltage-dependent calcium channel L type alpha-1D